MKLTEQPGFPREAWKAYNDNRAYEDERVTLRLKARTLRAKMYAAADKDDKASLDRLKYEKKQLDARLKLLNELIKEFAQATNNVSICYYQLHAVTRIPILPGVSIERNIEFTLTEIEERKCTSTVSVIK